MRLQGPLLEQMKSLYGPKFPIEVRHYLANWIESQTWADIDPESPPHEQEARRLFEGMLQALTDLITTYATNFITKTQLEALYTHMRNEYYNQPMDLVRVVQHCLFKEAELVDRQEHLNAPSPMSNRQPTNHSQIQQLLTSLHSKTEALEHNFRQLSARLENFMLQYQESFQIEAAFQQGNRIPPDQVGKYRQRKQMLDQALKQDAEEMKRSCGEIQQRFQDIVSNIQNCQGLLVNGELANWKQSQRLFNWEDDRGKVELNSMQQWFENLAEIQWRCRQIAKQFDLLKTRVPQGILSLDQSISFPQILTKILVSLIQASFVIEKQPPQVIKTSNRFSTSLRLLVGSKLQIHLGVPEVIVTIINDKQAKSIMNDPSKQIPANFSSGEILNNQKSMEYNSQNGILSSSFNFMQLRRIKRNSDKKASEMVTEEKFTLLYRTHFSIGGGELEVSVRTTSLPVVVIVHVTQQPPAEATIFWDNAFAEAQTREPFQVPDSVEWPRLSEALHCFFHANTGRGLTPPNLDYLGRKLLGVGPDEDIARQSVTRQQLCKDQLRGRGFTFWEWFYKHLDLIKSTLKREWVEGSIQGFMQKADAEKLLLPCAPGTFLIRFSEGEPGGVSVAWVTEGDMVSGERSVLSLAPWNKHELGMRAFADRLHDLTHLLIVYPNNPKDKVFSKYYSPPKPSETDPGGYITADLKLTHNFTPGAAPPPSPSLSIVSIGTPISPPWPPMNGTHDMNLSGLPDFSAGSMNYDATDLTSVLEGASHNSGM